MTMHTRREGRGPRHAATIHGVTLALLAEVGADRLTIEGVAERSGVNKTTLYRWWVSKDELIADSLLHADLLRIELPDTGGIRGDLIALFDAVADLFTAPESGAVVTAAIAAAVTRDALGGLVRDFFADRLSAEGAIFARAVARGELPDEVDPRLVVDLILGVVWVRLILRQEPLASGDAAAAVDAVLHGILLR